MSSLRERIEGLVAKIPHHQHTIWKDGIGIEECWPDCVRCALAAALAAEGQEPAVVEPIEGSREDGITISKEMFNNLCRFACANKHGQMPTHKEACLLSQIFNRYARCVQEGERERINSFLARVISYTNSAASPAGRAEEEPK